MSHPSAPRRPVLALYATFLIAATLAVGAYKPPSAGADPDLGAVELALAPVTSGLSSPVALAWRSGDARMYVAEQGGRVRIVDTTSGMVVGTALTLSGIGAGGERGLLGLTFSQDGTKMYVDHTDTSGTIHVVEYTMSGDTAVIASARELLSIAHPRTNHNGGEVTTGPDGYLYIGTGDGGGGGDPDLNGQNVNTLLGKILRIDPTPSATLPYTIPADNPFVGLADHREEIWMYGLRNPWRFTFDRGTGEMWIADVGQGLYEEVDFAPAGTSGTNWGWNLREGFHAYAGAQPPNGQDPLFEKAHSDGYCAVIGGYVYRGAAIANLNGAYVFGDLCRSVLSAAVQSGGAVTEQTDFTVGLSQITTFGEDHNGELYVANLGGSVYKLVPASVGAPTVAVGDKTLLEGNAGIRQMAFPVTLSQPGSATVSVQYTVAGVGATGGAKAGSGVDFKTKSGTVTFNVNGTGKTPISKVVSVPVYADTGVESDETLMVTLTSPTGGYELGRAVGTGTILDDDDEPGVTLGVGDSAIVQQILGSEALTTPVTLSARVPTIVTVNYTITPGSATYSSKKTGGGEFGGKLTGTIVFRPNATLRNISVPIWPDATPDADHAFTITLSGLSGSGVTVIRTTGTGNILDE